MTYFSFLSQVTFTGGRVVDSGSVFEPQGSRTHADFRELGLYQLVRDRLISDSLLPKWPQLKRIRLIGANASHFERKPHLFQVIDKSARVGSYSMIKLRLCVVFTKNFVCASIILDF